jgi:hypothetical protein
MIRRIVAQRDAMHPTRSRHSCVIDTTGPPLIRFGVDVVGRMVAGTQVLEESPGSNGRAAR